MKLGFGLYRTMLDSANLRFARQAGATHIVAHMPGDVSERNTQLLDAYGERAGHGLAAGADDPLWSYEGLRDLKALVNTEGLALEALENFSPAHWSDILLDGPRKRQQLEHCKRILRDMGRVGIPIMGYYFSVAGVWGHERGAWARGDAVSVGFKNKAQPPIPAGMVWNMIYDPEAFQAPGQSDLPPVSDEAIRQRFREFIDEMVPVAEEAGVRLALHPDDPPMPALRGAHRLAYTQARYRGILDVNPSPANALEVCLGTLAEMPNENIYETVDHLSRSGRIGYIHFRNVRGTVPNYEEVFVDEGDTDMVRILDILHRNGYDGVLIPDHTPLMDCAAPWHAGMAFAMGYIKAALHLIEQGR